MRKLLIFSLLALAACEDRAPMSGVDTTLPDEPILPATITGKMGYPSDYIPRDLQVCAEMLDGKKTFCNAEKNYSENTYELKVPPGSYRVFAQTSQQTGYKAYFTEFVVCGYDASCPSHKVIVVKVAAGETRSEVHPNDWYADSKMPDPEPMADDVTALDANMTMDPNMSAADEAEVQADALEARANELEAISNAQ